MFICVHLWLTLPLSAADPVPVGPMERRSLTRTVEQPGRIDPFAQTPIQVRVTGFIKSVHADIGDRVKAGQLLAEIDAPELAEEFRQKQALVLQAAAEIVQAEKLVAVAVANVKLAAAAVAEAAAARKRAVANHERWRLETARVDSLVSKKVIDEQTRDETMNQFRSAESLRDEVEAKVRSAESARLESEARRDKAIADVAVAKAKAAVAAADERRVQALLDYARVTAPFDGTVTARQVDVGHLVQPGKDAPLFVVTACHVVRVFVDVPEIDAAAISNDSPAVVRVQGLRGREFRGAVTRTGWALDTKARTLRTEIDLKNEDGALRPGMYAYTAITVTTPPVWTLPASALVKTADGSAAFLVKDGKASRVNVQTGHATATHVEVLKWQSSRGWMEPTGGERFVLKAAGVAEGHLIERP